MKYFLILFLTILSGCCEPPKDSAGLSLPRRISKFKDGDVTCYMYSEHGISCLKDSE